MVGTENRGAVTAAGGGGSRVAEELVSSDGNFDDYRGERPSVDEMGASRQADQHFNLVHGIGNFAVMPLGISSREGARRRGIPQVLGHTATTRHAPYSFN